MLVEELLQVKVLEASDSSAPSTTKHKISYKPNYYWLGDVSQDVFKSQGARSRWFFITFNNQIQDLCVKQVIIDLVMLVEEFLLVKVLEASESSAPSTTKCKICL